MTEYNEDDYLMLSGIQHFSFCKRQWALIHIENQWEENTRTYGGQEMHEKADDPFLAESRGDTVISRSIPLVSHSLKIYGIADVVEFHRKSSGITIQRHSGLWQPTPIEYKYGQKKAINCDEVQLCAQAVCLEEMLGISIRQGYLYYGKTRRREEVNFSGELRMQVAKICAEMWELFQKGATPKAEYRKSCLNCSLYHLCKPETFEKRKSALKYINKAFEEERL